MRHYAHPRTLRKTPTCETHLGSREAAARAHTWEIWREVMPVGAGVNGVAVQPNGQIVVGGAHFLATSPVGLARLNTDGSLDTTFCTSGTLTTTIQGNEAAQALLLQPDGKIIAVGFSENNSTGVADVLLARYLGH
jgi:uncharacterized delta-60 repeat protein